MFITFYHLKSHQPGTCHPRAFAGSGAFARVGAAFGAWGPALAATLAAGALAAALQWSQYSWHQDVNVIEKL